MSDQTVTPSTDGAFDADLRGVHYDFLKARVPLWFTEATRHRQEELANHTLEMPSWYLSATRQQKSDLSDRHSEYRKILNKVDKTLGTIQDVLAFAEQPLKTAIKLAFNLDIDVKNAFFARKYAAQQRSDFGGALAFGRQADPTLDVEYRGLSLLETALANFTAGEEEKSDCEDCELITFETIDSYETYDSLNAKAVGIAPHEFAKLCRGLDLGKRYQEHLQLILQPREVVRRSALESELEEHQRQLMALSAEFASLKPMWGGIGADVYAMIKQVIADPLKATLDGKPVTYAALKVFGIELVGPLLIGPSRTDSQTPERLVVYIPHDPQQPLKEYPDSAHFMVDLRGRLHSASYRRFFSRFVPQRQQGSLFQQFNALFKPENGNGASGDYPIAAKPSRLPLGEREISGSLWEALRQLHVRKIFADARAVAVPTDDENRTARKERLDGFLDAVVSVFNLAAFVVPGLGPIMMAVGAMQMCNEVFDGLEAYQQGDLRTMWAHFSSVALNVAFIAAGAKVLPEINSVNALDTLKPVTLPNGKQRLWKPDMSGYHNPHPLPRRLMPDEMGLYSVDGKRILVINGFQYEVQQDRVGEDFRIAHPTRPEAYQPRLTGNRSGAWNHELERPLTWQGETLMRRLGPVVEGFSDAELEQVRQVADVSEETLRRLHVEGEPAPAILLDTLDQFRAYRGAIDIAEGIRQGSLRRELCAYAASLLVELPRWPANRAVEVFAATELSGPSVKYGNGQALAADTVRVHRGELMTGQLAQRVAETLTDSELDGLVGSGTPRSTVSRAAALTAQLERYAVGARRRLMNSLYAEQQPATDSSVELLQRDFNQLPSGLAREVLADATAAERNVMSDGQRIPLRLAQKARAAQQQMRLTRAYEGLYLDALAGPDTEALVLNSLERLPGWTDNLRLEVREEGLEGPLRASFGPSDAPERKVLVWFGDERYQARNLRDEDLSSVEDLYSAIQHALTDRHREALGLPHIKQGAALKAKIIEHALPREKLRQVLKMQPRKRPFFTRPRRLAGGRLGYPLSGRGRTPTARVFEERARRLYPTLADAQLDAFITQLGPEPNRALRRLEREFAQLQDTLQDWQRAQVENASDQERDSDEFASRRLARLEIIKALQHAWQRTGEQDLGVTGESQGQILDLSGTELHGELERLPPLTANFSHVSLLDLSGTGLEGGVDTFLGYFKQLRKLSLDANELIEVPHAIGDMVHLTELDLSDNLIALDDEGVQTLRGLSRLNYLALEGNPLGMSPDISQMPDLAIVMLANTGLTAWPPGVFAVSRDAWFFLDLSANPLEQIPDVTPGSAQALTVARTYISQDPEFISAERLQTYRDYRISVGMDPYRLEPPRGVQDSILWRAGLSDEEWEAKQGAWNSLENEHGSEPFFRELRKLADSADAIAPTDAVKAELAGKVWQMVEAAAGDSRLRDNLFKMATAPTTCVDAGAQLFNAMGLEVLIMQAYELGAQDLIESELVTLARGKSRLDELGSIARARIRELLDAGRKFPEYDENGSLIRHYDSDGNVLKDIDEVEIHLIYPTQLGERLELPWQSRNMRFNEPDVTPQMIDEAYTRVLALEEGPLLGQKLIEQPFWSDFVRQSDPQAFEALRVRIDTLLDRLTALEPISQEEYDADMLLIAAEEKTLLLTLTEQALKRAGLQSTATPPSAE